MIDPFCVAITFQVKRSNKTSGDITINDKIEPYMEKQYQFSSQSQSIQVTCGIYSFIRVRELDFINRDRTMNTGMGNTKQMSILKIR